MFIVLYQLYLLHRKQSLTSLCSFPLKVILCTGKLRVRTQCLKAKYNLVPILVTVLYVIAENPSVRNAFPSANVNGPLEGCCLCFY